MKKNKKLILIILIILVIIGIITFIRIKYKNKEENTIHFENYKNDIIKIYDVNISKIEENNILSFKVLGINDNTLVKKINVSVRLINENEVIFYSRFYIDKISTIEPFTVTHNLDANNINLKNIKIEYEIEYDQDDMIIMPKAG